MKLEVNKKVNFDPVTHSYLCGGKELIGVTSLMKKHGLSVDYTGRPEKVLAYAAARGTAIHQTLENYDNGVTVTQPASVLDSEGNVITFDTSAELDAYRKLGLPVIASEYLVSDNKVVASSIDKVAVTPEGEVWLLDIKTTAQQHLDALCWQLSIYAYLFELQNPKLKVVRLTGVFVRNGKAKTREVNRIPSSTIRELIAAEESGNKFAAPAEDLPDASSIVPASVLADAERQLSELKDAIKLLETRIDEDKAKLYDYMAKNNVPEMKCGDGVYKIKYPSLRTSIDTKALKNEMPQVFKKYSKQTEVKGCIIFKNQE